MVHEGPRPTHMFGTVFAYSIRDRFGIYGDLGLMPNIEYHTFATSPTSQGISLATGNRDLLMVNSGAFVTRLSGFVRPYAYAGVGVIHDDYSWSTQVVSTHRKLLGRFGVGYFIQWR